MPTVELSDEELAELAALRKTKAVPEQAPADAIPGLSAPESAPKPIPPKAKRPTDRKKPAPRTPRIAEAASPKVSGSFATSDDDYSLGLTPLGGDETDLKLPSGALCRVKVIGPESLLSSGLLDSVDSLSAIVSGDMIPTAERGRPAVDAAALAKDMTAIKQVIDTYDDLMFKVVVKPVLYDKPDTESERIAGRAYIDKISFEDKAFIMQFVMGGTSDLETFRQESEESVASVAAVTGTAG